MHERDDCSSLAKRTEGATILCAFFVDKVPIATVEDHTGSYKFQCELPDNIPLDKGDLYLFHVYFQNNGRQVCNRVTPIPKVLYCVYQKLLEEFRESKKPSKPKSEEKKYLQ